MHRLASVFLTLVACAGSLVAQEPHRSATGSFAVGDRGGITASATNVDIVVYGGTSAGVIAAVQAARMGKSVCIVCPEKQLGGMTSGGLGFSDTGNKSVIGGLVPNSTDVFWKHYDQAEAWCWQSRSEYGNKGQGTPAIDGEHRTMWVFEPHVAEHVFEDLIREYRIDVQRNEWLDRTKGVKKSGARIDSITMQSGKTFAGKMFIDATYEGDLMAAAGVDYHVGREANDVYGERWNGVQVGVLHHRHHFGDLKHPISPYVVPGDAQSGLLPRISAEPPGVYGAGDKRVQAYCFRLCLTDHPDNRVPFAKPDSYDPKQYELLVRIFDAGWRETFMKFDAIPNRKTDTNNHGPMSTDDIGMNYDYPEASYERRREITQEHQLYEQGWLYFIANDPRVPADVRTAMQRWGLAKDEFVDTDHWPHQLYVREARRMIGKYVMTEHELLKERPTPESVGMGHTHWIRTTCSGTLRRKVMSRTRETSVCLLGGPTRLRTGPSCARSKSGQVDNLLVPVCLSSSHIAYGSMRMEPVFMILGQSVGTAAVLAIDNGCTVQDVPRPRRANRLHSDGQTPCAFRSDRCHIRETMIAAHPDRPSGEIGHAGAGGGGTSIRVLWAVTLSALTLSSPPLRAGYHGGMRRTYLGETATTKGRKK